MELKVLVTGGAGYIGSHTVRKLAEAGYQVLIYDNFSRGHRQAIGGFEVVEGDIADQGKVKRILEQHSVGAVMHFAAHSQVGESVEDPLLYYTNNVGGGIALLRAVLSARVKYFIFSSSAAVYGDPEAVPINEKAPLNPGNPYGETKMILERLLADCDRAYGLKAVSLRYFNAAGAAQDGEIGEDHHPETHLIPLALQVLLGKRDNITVYGNDYPTPDGTPIRDYIHVDDLARAHVLALGYLVKGGATAAFNLGNGRGFSVLEVIETVEQVTGQHVLRRIGRRRAGDPAVLVAGSERIRKVLGWQPNKPDLATIITDAWAWHSNNPQGFSGL